MHPASHTGGISWIRVGVLALALGLPSLGRGPEIAPTNENVVKARLIRVALDYVEWPGTSGSYNGARVVAVLGSGPLGEELARLVAGQNTARIPMRVVFISRISQPITFQALLIQEGESANLPLILAAMKDRPVLTLGDTPGFAEQGVMLNLVREEGRIRMEANLGAVKAARLEMSSALILKTRVVGRPPAP